MIRKAEAVVIGSGGFGAAKRRAAAWEYRHFYSYDTPSG
jgi:hypothetical protein